MRIIFLGTPDFAVASLQALVENEFNVVAVVTAPDKPSGRGMKLQSSAVKVYANSKHLPVLQPERLKSEDFLKQLKSYQADVQVVVAFRMLPELVWNMPPLGTINVHASLLPDYRGAAPIHWAIMNGEKETGVTTFRLKHEIDTGNILLQKKVSIRDDDNLGSLYNTLMHEGAELLIETMKGIQIGTLQEHVQSLRENLHHAPKITKEICLIHWNETVASIHNKIRALNPAPGAYTKLNGKVLKLYSSRIAPKIMENLPGHISTDNKTFLHITATDGFIDCIEVQAEGKSRMSVQEFLKGNKIEEGTIIS